LNQIPLLLRWRLVALRGQCSFQIREFQHAQRDFLTAIAILPDPFPNEYFMEVVLLRLHLAASLRELGQYEEAHTLYQDALAMMNETTPLRYIAEAHWGISLVLYEQALQHTHEPPDDGEQYAKPEHSEKFKTYMKSALKHAESARTLYSSIVETLRTALLSCQIALIQQSLENLDQAREQLEAVLKEWEPTIDKALQYPSPGVTEKIRRYNLKERANVVSAALCYLASIEHEANDCDKALMYIDQALEAAKESYILRRADAYMAKGQILAGHDDEQATEAFRSALRELEKTDRLGAKIRVHQTLGAHLLNIGRKEEGERELEEVVRLTSIPAGNKATPDDTDKPDIILN
jgi:tetratricopeptide (TPR) repeat protein